MSSPHFGYENKYKQEYDIIVGIDEAGRGSLAGPVCVAAYSFPSYFYSANSIKWIFEVTDSKKVSPAKREYLYSLLEKHAAYSKKLLLSSRLIDTIGINATIEKGILHIIRDLVFYKGFKKIKLLIDGNYNFSFSGLNQRREGWTIAEIRKTGKLHSMMDICYQNSFHTLSILSLPGGDSISFSIASASILAKVFRDTYMKKISGLFPQYEFEKHKGYGTAKHREHIFKYGLTFLHRRSYLKKITSL